MTLVSNEHELDQLDRLGKYGGSLLNPTGSFGMKYDGGKILGGILTSDFPRALEAIAIIGTYGAKKYARSSWITVPDAVTRYNDAMVRHQLAMGREELYDEESHLLHHAHFAWNALATLELLLRAGVSVHESNNTKLTGTNPNTPRTSTAQYGTNGLATKSSSIDAE